LNFIAVLSVEGASDATKPRREDAPCPWGQQAFCSRANPPV
jgi:hypothetical protein